MKVLVVGDPIIDIYTYVDINRMSPEDNSVPVLDIIGKTTSLGGALNVALITKSELDFENDVFVAAPMSKWTIAELTFRNIAIVVESFFSEEWKPSSGEMLKERIINNKTKKQIVRIDDRLFFQQNTVDRFKKAFSGIVVDDFDCIVVSDYAKGCVGWFIVDKLKGLGCPIFVDTKQKDLSMWKDLDNIFVKINWKEFETASHTNQIKNLIITHGEKPVQLRKYGQLIRQFDVKPVKNPNVIGAGDAFLSGLVAEYLRSENIEKSIEFAIEVARKSVER